MVKDQINLLIINYSFNVGGIEILIKSLCEFLDRNLYNITLCSLSSNNELEDDFKKFGISIVVLKKRVGLDFTLPFKLRKLCNDLRIDVMHTHNATAWLYGVFSCLFIRKPVIIHTQHTILEKEEGLQNSKKSHFGLLLMMRILALRTFKIVSIADYISEYLIKKALIDRNKITRIYNGTAFNLLEDYDAVGRLREELGLEKDDFVVGIIARLVKKKGHEVLLEAFRHVNSTIKAKLLIVGDGVLRNKLENACRRLGVQNEVIFLGRRNDVPTILRLLDVFVLSSYKDAEGLPVCLLEAMSARIPVVATDSGGVKEIVLHKRTGFLVSPDDPVALSQAIIQLKFDRPLTEKIIKEAENRVKEVFSLQKMVANYSSLYQIWPS